MGTVESVLNLARQACEDARITRQTLMETSDESVSDMLEVYAAQIHDMWIYAIALSTIKEAA